MEPPQQLHDPVTKMVEMLREMIAERGTPMHPEFAHVLEGGTDPSARESANQFGETISARLRSVESAYSYYAMEGCMIGLTPLGMLAISFALLQILSGDHGEMPEGIDAAYLDPWKEIGPFQEMQIPEYEKSDTVTLGEECRRALWHVGRCLEAVSES